MNFVQTKQSFRLRAENLKLLFAALHYVLSNYCLLVQSRYAVLAHFPRRKFQEKDWKIRLSVLKTEDKTTLR